MILIGTYPDGFEYNDLKPKLTYLMEVIDKILPRDITLHLLPFYPSSGDYGFAPDNWFQVRKDLGNWDDIRSFSSKWKLLVDGIYNHVGINHKWVKDFYNNPNEVCDFFYTFKSIVPNQGPLSPRGHEQFVLKNVTSELLLWQTFTDSAVDIRLDNNKVKDEIESHLKLLKKFGIWGVRLDAIAYYSKMLGNQVRHNPGVYELANSMADRIESHGLKILAQLDCDEDGLKYFQERTGEKRIPINDFTYSSYFILSIIEQNPILLIKHIEETQDSGRIIIRIPRTHDGILLRSKLLQNQNIDKIIDYAKQMNIKIRESNGKPYEINCSLPYLFSSLDKKMDLSKTILFSIAVTGMISGWSYFYLPYILGYMPELSIKQTNFEDPRAINRKEVSISILNQYLTSSSCAKTKSLLETLLMIHNLQDLDFKSIPCIENNILILTTIDDKYRLVANFSRTKKNEINKKWIFGNILESNDFNENILGELGFVIIEIKN